MKKRPLLATAAFTLISVMPVGTAVAAPVSGLEGLGKPVSDEALGTMRGKFVAPSGITYFGIVMSSSWQDSNGITTAATLLFDINFAAAGSGQPVPQLMISWSRECPNCGDSSMDLTNFGASASNGYVALTGNGSSVPIGSLDSVTGAVQSQQIAGSDNQSRNLMTIEIVPAASINPDTSGMTALAGNGQTEQFGDGETLQFNVSDRQLGLSISGRNGAVEQNVDGMLGQLAQHVLISGSDITASNSMDLMVGIDPAAAAQRLNIQGALSAMKGMGF
ncbi:MAG TPA: hypothetical protein VFW39_11890 [Sphingomicrobium sp.]|nr:hypothetical protein [Sphingomicrobium sp.]